MIELVQGVFGNWADIVVGLTAIVTGASILAKLTPNTVDDGIVKTIQKLLDTLAINNKRAS